ncbi:MAG: energy-coupling factor transporter transmembrane component T [Anaerolineae bacterium]
MKRLSAWGYLVFTLWGLGMGVAVKGWRLGALVLLELVFGFFYSRQGLGPLRRWRFWVFIGAAVALGPLVGRGAGQAEESIALSWGGLSVGLEMAGRALTLLLAFSLGLSSLSLSDLLAIFDGLGLRGLGFALGVAMNLLGTLQEMARSTFETIRLRGGLRRPTVALRLFMVTLVSNTLRYGDQVVKAASVRAFDPQRGRGSGLPLRRADVWLAAVLASCSVVCGLL